MNTTLKTILLFVIVTGGSVATGPAVAQSFPSKPVRIIVPATAGNPSDILARILAPKLSEGWGQPVVLENRPGAGGTLGAAQAAKASPDGYTLLMAVGAFVTSAALQTNLPYDPVKDFSGVAQLGFPTAVLIMAPALGIKSVKELIALGKAQPGKILFGSAGAGGGSHFLAERVRLAQRIDSGNFQIARVSPIDLHAHKSVTASLHPSQQALVRDAQPFMQTLHHAQAQRTFTVQHL